MCVFFCLKRYKSCDKATFPQFMIGGKDIEIVKQWSHLGHILPHLLQMDLILTFVKTVLLVRLITCSVSLRN